MDSSREISQRQRKNARATFFANIVAQAAPALALPIIARQYSPDAVGGQGAFLALAGAILAFVTFRADWLVIAERRRMHASLIQVVATVLAVLSLLLCGLLLELWSNLGGPFAWGQSSWAAVLLLAFYAAAMSFNQFVSGWYARSGNLIRPAIARASQTVIATGMSIGFGYSDPSANSLVYSLIIGVLCGSAVLCTNKSIYRDRNGFAPVAFRLLRKRGRQYLKRIFVNGGASVANAVGHALPSLIVGWMYGAQALGWFAVAMRLAVTPTLTLGAALGQSGVVEIAGSAQDQALRRAIFSRLARNLWVFSAVASVACGFSPFVMPFVLGNGWEEVGGLLLCMMPYVLGQAAVSPLGQICPIARLGRFLLIWDVLRSISAVGTVMLLGWGGLGIYEVIFSYSMISLVFYGVLYFRIRRWAFSSHPLE